MIKTMGGIPQIGTCTIDYRGKPKAGWPYFGKRGHWVLTAPCYVSSKPFLESEWFTITHAPTGFRAASVRVDNPRRLIVLEKFHQMFGRSSTKEGVMRKYRKLNPRQKAWILAQNPWQLPSKKVKAAS